MFIFNPFRFASAGVDADAQAFLTAAGISDPTISEAIDTLVKGLKGEGLWSKIQALYPMVGGTADSHKFNLKDPRDADAAFRLTWYGGWVHSSTGAKPNGTTGWADTHFVPSTNGGLANFHLAYYSRENRSTWNVPIGAWQTSSGAMCQINLSSGSTPGVDTGNVTIYTNNTIQASLSGIADTFGFFIGSRTDNSSLTAYRRGEVVTKNTSSLGGDLRPTIPLALGARNTASGATRDNFTNIESAGASIGFGLTDADAEAYSILMQSFNMALGRAVPLSETSLTADAAIMNVVATAESKQEWFDGVSDLLGNSRRVILSKDNVVFRNCAFRGDLVFDGTKITDLGECYDTSVYSSADLSSGDVKLRIEGNGHWIEGTLGLLGSGKHFIMSNNPTTSNGLGLGAIEIWAPADLPDGPPIPEGLITTFDLTNWSASPTSVLFRGGMPFKKGDVPAGVGLEILRGGAPVAAQFDERATWSDGSLKFAVCHMRDADLAGSATRTYEIHTVAGGFNNSGAVDLSDVVVDSALTVEVSTLQQYDGSSSVQRGSGAALAVFANHAAVPTRVTKIHSGPVCEGWQVWGMFRDGADGAGSEDAHLKVNWYVDVWKDENGNVVDTEFAAELTQDWWGVAGKYRLDYTATLKRNASTIQAYAGVQHPYHARWATVQMQDDNNHARRHWVSDTPTLTYKFDKEYWRKTHIVPPYDPDQTPVALEKTTYTPLGNMQHRAGLDEGGGYMGRGLLPKCDATAFARQGADDFRNARTNALAGLGITRHFRDERPRTRPSESADVANTLIPLLWDPQPSSASTFAGLPTPKHAYRGTHGGLTGGYEPYVGGSGVWSESSDASHAVPYSAFAYMVEGERYFLEASINLATANAHLLNSNIYGGLPYIHWYENASAQAEMSIPSTQYAAIPDYRGQERSLGWSAAIMAPAVALTPDSDPQSAYLKGWAAQCGDYLEACIEYTPPSVLAAGITFLGGEWPIRSPWMEGFIVQGCTQAYLMTEVPGFATYANMVVRSTVAMTTRNMYDHVSYRRVVAGKAEAYAAGNYNAVEHYLVGPSRVTVASNIVTLEESDVNITPIVVAEGDLLYFMSRTNANAYIAVPSGYVEGTPLYAVEVSGSSFKVATTPSGTPISVAAGEYVIAGEYSGRAHLTEVAYPPYMPPGDSYAPIAEATLAIAETAQLPSCPPGTYAAVREWLAPADRTTAPQWVFKPVGSEEE